MTTFDTVAQQHVSSVRNLKHMTAIKTKYCIKLLVWFSYHHSNVLDKFGNVLEIDKTVQNK